MKYTASFLRPGLIPAAWNNPVIFKFNSNWFLIVNLEPSIDLFTMERRMRMLKG